jgi:UDP-N-acetylmuramoylalanine--D-glutamate ligase
MIQSLQGKRIGIVGMARSGIGAARLVHRLGGTALISDTRKPNSLAEAICEIDKLGFEYETGGHRRIIDERFDWIVLSPGVIPTDKMLAAWSTHQSEILSELEFAARSCKSRWIGVTGSNGKTTTCNLIYAILKCAGLNAKLVGNVGIPWSEFLPADEDTIFVVEVSSFQLERVSQIRPDVAVILNIFENHLDRHASIDEYADIKFRLAARQNESDFFIFNGDDTHLLARERGVHGTKIRFGKSEECEWQVNEERISYKENGNAQFSIRNDAIPLLGFHNRLNSAAAAAAARCIGVDFESIDDALKHAVPVEHRLEFVRELDAVRYVNDSKSTNMVATTAAIDSLDTPILLLFGGRPKKESFEKLNDFLTLKVRHLFAFGEASPKVRSEVYRTNQLTFVETMHDALLAAKAIANPGDTILLSPGCPSFDQFSNFEERGRIFKSLVMDL